MDLGRTRRIELLAERPPLTGTRWPPWSSTSPNCTRSSRRGGSKSRSGSSTSRTSSCWAGTGIWKQRSTRRRRSSRTARLRMRDLDARGTACLDPRITAGSESFSMSCRRRSKRAACAATSTSSAAHRLRPRLPRRRRRPEHRLRRRPHEKGRRRAHRRDQGRGPRPRRKRSPSATDWTTTGSTSMRRSSCRAATMCGRRSSTTALESSSPAPWPSTCWR